MIEFNNQTFAKGILDSYSLLFEGLVKPVIEAIIQIIPFDPIADIFFAITLVGMVITFSLGCMIFAIKRLKNPL